MRQHLHALDQAHHQCARLDLATQLAQDVVRKLVRHTQHQQVGALHSGGQIGPRNHIGAQLHARQVARVLVLAVNVSGQVWVAHPHGHLQPRKSGTKECVCVRGRVKVVQ
jgi:hypothetical protein